jgi:signal transduction histidine kinase
VNNPHVEMTLALAENLPPVWGDADQLHQVLLNLTINAMHAVKEGGRVRIRTGVVLDGQDAPPPAVQVAVTDSGPGIPREELARIFDPFFTTKDAVGGTGLGLAISREIVRSHHGEIRVETGLEKGSCFIVTFPVATHGIANGVTSKDSQKA